MARNSKSGGFNKVLEFIGLVDDEDPRDTYEDEYESGNYGRAQTYAPQRTVRTQTRPRQEMTTRRSTSAYEPTRTPRMSRSTSASSRFDQPARASQSTARRSNAYVERSDDRAGRYDYTPRTSHFGSLEDEPATRYGDESALQSPARASGARQRTVMFSLHSLEDCCDVIDNLILNNTVVLTMDDLDARLMQRAVDTLSGAVFALHATIRKASERTYLIAPANVEVNETYDMDRRF